VLTAHRTRSRLRIVVGICAAYILLAGAIAAVVANDGLAFWASFGWWLGAIPIGLAAYLAVEALGTWGLGLAFWQRMPSWARILLLVALICAIAVGVIFVSPFVSHRGSL